MNTCTCGHLELAHPGRGPCMDMECSCDHLTEPTQGTQEQAARRMLGDEVYDRIKRDNDTIRAAQVRQHVATGDVITARADLLDQVAALVWAIRVLVMVVPFAAVAALLLWVVSRG